MNYKKKLTVYMQSGWIQVFEEGDDPELHVKKISGVQNQITLNTFWKIEHHDGTLTEIGLSPYKFQKIPIK